MCVQLLDSAWTDLQKASEAQKALGDGGHAPSDNVLLKHPTILLRLFIMSYLRSLKLKKFISYQKDDIL